jgi:hypothetical protein
MRPFEAETWMNARKRRMLKIHKEFADRIDHSQDVTDIVAGSQLAYVTELLEQILLVLSSK